VNNDTLANSLNRHCHCINVDHDALQASLETRIGERGVWSRLQETHPHLLATAPVFVSSENIEQMQAVIAAIERVAELPGYQDHVLDWAPAIARISHGPQGVFFGYDFHLTNNGPKLIEVNTNAGGALLLLHVASAQQACCEEVEDFVTGRIDIADLEHEFVEMFRKEVDTQFPGKDLHRIAIVDENPEQQFLSPEFELFRQMFARHDINAIVAGPDEFELRDGQLLADNQVVEVVYNRLTDFYLQSDLCAVLNESYASGAAVFTPGPHTHALYANKRNLTVLSDQELLQSFGIDADTTAVLATSVPRTECVTSENADDLWARRRQLFFKPNWGFGSRGTYKGAKLTKKTWNSILEADYIAQELVPPSERLLIVDGDQQSLKLDVRCYVYDGEIQLLGARLYRGQTTNFRTDGGGLAAVFMAPAVTR
jgi:glutathione synthase/RimK-type ligase-like ATP-grasp enzyme